jgi:diguanylate cyclase (GGDEF)-like protein/PAS domain S-box-containing protein
MTFKVLVIDDNEDDRIAVRFALRGMHCTVETAPNVARGLVAVELFRPDVILLDYSMQDSNGIEFISRLRENNHENMPALVMMTGVGNEMVAVQALRAGACDYLIKDVEGNHLKLLPAILERVERECNVRRNQHENQRQLQLTASVYANIREGVLVTSTDNVILTVNPALCAITGYAADELIGQTPQIFKSNRHSADFYADLWKKLTNDGQWCGEIWNRRKDGSAFLARETITAILDTDGQRLNYLAVMADITDCRSVEDALRHRAYHDDLTGLPNRCLFLDRLRHQIAYAERYKRLLAVLFIDLDRFKSINDDLGHDHGDDLLKEAAARLHQCVRESDTVARWGGDEFIVLLNDLDHPEHAAQISRKIIDQLEIAFNVKSYQVQISGSIGIAVYPNDETDIRRLILAADTAMYSAKKAGGGTLHFAGTKNVKVGSGGTATAVN